MRELKKDKQKNRRRITSSVAVVADAQIWSILSSVANRTTHAYL